MSGPRLPARVMMGLATAMVGVLALAAPAAADVTVTPSTGVQGGVLKLLFRVSEDRPPAHTVSVELQLPESSPVAEVYPISVPDWAPKIAMRRLDRPLQSLHGRRMTSVVSSVTWIRVTEAAGGPAPLELKLSLGPLPNTDLLSFTVVQTYSDGTVVRWADPPAAGNGPPKNPAPVIKLRPPEPDAGQAGEDTGGDPGSGYAIFYAVLLIGIVAGIGSAGWILLRRRSRRPHRPHRPHRPRRGRPRPRRPHEPPRARQRRKPPASPPTPATPATEPDPDPPGLRQEAKVAKQSG